MPNMTPEQKTILKVRKNWREDLVKGSLSYSNDNISISESLLAGILMCESSGQRNVRPRYEPAVFQRLSKIEKAEPLDIYIASASHGPFQIMGYHAKEMHYFGKGYGTLPFSIQDIYKKPVECCSMFLTYNCASYLKPGKEEYEKVVRIYNGGSPTASNKITNAYVERFAYYKRKYLDSFVWVPNDGDLDNAITQ